MSANKLEMSHYRGLVGDAVLMTITLVALTSYIVASSATRSSRPPRHPKKSVGVMGVDKTKTSHHRGLVGDAVLVVHHLARLAPRR